MKNLGCKQPFLCCILWNRSITKQIWVYVIPSSAEQMLLLTQNQLFQCLSFMVRWDKQWVFFGHNSKKFVWKSKGEALKPENTVPTVMYGGGSWGCFKFQIIYFNLNSSTSFQPGSNMWLKLWQYLVFQQHNDAKHTSKLV